MNSHLSNSCTSLRAESSPSIPQVRQVDEVAVSLQNLSLADTSVRDELAVLNTLQYNSVQEYTPNLGMVEERIVTQNTLETGQQLPRSALDDKSYSSPSIPQVRQVDEVAVSVENLSLANTSVRDEVAVQNTLQYNSVQEYTTNLSTVEESIVTKNTLETGQQLPISALDDEGYLREQLKSLECPFTWKIQNESARDTTEFLISRINEKVEEIEEDAFQWRKFNLMLVLCYEHFGRGVTPASWEAQRICEQILDPSEPKGEYESFYHATKDALLHVVYSCKCHLLFATGLLIEARQILQKVRNFEEMDNACKAAIWGIRATVSMEYGYEGTKAAIEYSKKAQELDPRQGEWHFLFGKALGRIRRTNSFNEIPAQEELKALEQAVQLTKNASYIIFLAQAYREASFRVFSIHRYDLAAPLKEQLDRMNTRSYELYKEALTLRGECAHINIRCAQGFSKLPHPYRDLELAKQCCGKALALAPNNAMSNHIAASIYERYDKDVERAKRHFQIAGELGAYGAYMDLYRLKYSEDNKYDPIPEFEFLLSRFKEKPRKEDTMIQMGSFYLFVKDDLTTAYSQYWSKVISENPDSEKLKNHKCIFVNMRTPLNIYELIFDEARLRLRNTNHESLADEDHKMLRQIIIKYSELLPELLRASPKPRRKMAFDEATSVDTRRSRSQRGRGRRGGRPRGHGRGRGRGDSNRGNRSQSREGLKGGNNGGRFFGNYNRYTSRNSSTESMSSHRAGYHHRAGSRDSSSESSNRNRGDYHHRVGSRDSSTESRNINRGDYHHRVGSRDSSSESKNRNRGDYQRRVGSRDSSTESRNSNRGDYYHRVGSRDSSTESRNSNRGDYHHRFRSHETSIEGRGGHHSKERNFGSNWRQRTDSNDDSRGTQDNNWRSEPRNFDQMEEGKLGDHHDSINSSVDSRSDHGRKYDKRYQTYRTDSLSSTRSTSDVSRTRGGGRIRTESNSSVGSDTRRDWKQGCCGGGPKVGNNDKNWRVDEGSKLGLSLGGRHTDHSGSWRGVGDGIHGSQRSGSYDRGVSREYKVNRDSGGRISSMNHYREKRDTETPSSTRASQGEDDDKKHIFHRGGVRVKAANFQMSWQKS